MDGWIKLYRRLTAKPIWLNSSTEHKVILIAILLLANHAEKKWEWKGKSFEAKPGQFVSSAESIIRTCGRGVSRQNIRSALHRFKKLEFLTYETTNTGMLISVVNWQAYQDEPELINQESNQEPTNNQPTTNQQVTTNKNVRKKECKNDKKIYSAFSEKVIESIERFIEMRKAIKKPITDYAVSLMIKKLNALGKTDEEKIAVLNQSILKSWADIFPIKADKQSSEAAKIEEFQKKWGA